MNNKVNFNFIEPELTEPDVNTLQPASYIRKEFVVSGNAKKAMLHITALGVYNAFLNGAAVGNQLLTPGYTNYFKRIQYQTYDVTEMISEGINAIGVILGDGWYRGCLGMTSKRGYYGRKTALAAVLEIETDQERILIHSDIDWKATQDGPIRQNDIKTYETVDAEKELTGWNCPDYDDSMWHECMQGNYEGDIVPQEGEAVIEHEHFRAKVLVTPDGEQILDFGQNLAGHIEFTVTGHAGHKVSLTMGEVLDENKNFTLKNLVTEGSDSFNGDLGQKLTYILREGTQTYKSQFLISGYRYARLENWPEEIKAENFVSIAVYSDVKETGFFQCSNEKINQLVSNSKWSQKSNFVDIPTDCPTRERAGWTGDINVFSETAAFYTDVRKFLRKWLNDFISLQREDGNLPYIVPQIPFELMGHDFNPIASGSAGWSDALSNVTMTLYRFYADKSFIETAYEPLKRFVAFNRERAKRRNPAHESKPDEYYDYILDTGYHYGEWLEPGAVMTEEAMRGFTNPDEEVATGWWYNTVNQVAQMAEILGKADEAEEYRALAEKIKYAYRQEFVVHGIAEPDRQCKYVRPVAMGLTTREESQKLMDDLANMAGANEYRIGTGFLTTYQILAVLSQYGHSDTAYKILENEKSPGWLYEVNKGATTTWENWYGVSEKGVPLDSQNHYAPGAALSWLFTYCCGIHLLKPGFEEIEIRPIPGGSLTWAKAEYHSVRGKIVSHWEKKDGKFLLHVEIPESVSASAVLPDGQRIRITKNIEDFECSYEVS